MFQPDATANEQFWRRRATMLAARLNLHHTLSRLVPKLFFLLILTALCELLRRQMGSHVQWSAGVLAIGLAVVMGWAWLEARRKFCSRAQALVRLETIHRLHNRLSAAADGVVAWPAPLANVNDGYEPNWRHILVPAMAGLLFLMAAHLVPVRKFAAWPGSGTISEPPDFAQVQNWINALKVDDLIEPEKLQDMQSALGKLRQRSPQDWYSQSNLEAADSLKELAEQSMNSLADDLNKADAAADAMRKNEEANGDSQALKDLANKLGQSADSLSTANLPLNHKLTDAMKQAGANAFSDKALSASQLKKLQAQLKQAKATCAACTGNGNPYGKDMQNAIGEAMKHGLAARMEGEPGSGGPGGGGPPAPLVLQERNKESPDGKLTGLSNDDMSHISLGETIKITTGTPTADPASYRGLQAAGAATVTGTGGEAVWRSTYDPQEADTLTRFFK
jgi:hypothetical protein